MGFIIFVIVIVTIVIRICTNDASRGDGRRRGRRLLTMQEADALAKKECPNEKDGLYWGGIYLPQWVANTHFLVLGTTGSGKTITIRLLLQSLLSPIGRGRDRNDRAILYDNKQEMIGILFGMGVNCSTHTLHPFDARGAAWHMAEDCHSVVNAQQFAANMIPEEQGPNRFFSASARDILTGVFVSLMVTCPGQWRLRDVILITQSRDLLEEFLSRSPATQGCRQYFQDERTLANILASLASYLAPFGPIAACWEHSSDWISLSDWSRTGSILILGNDDAARFAIDAVNRMIVQCASERVLAGPEGGDSRSIFVFDEAREAGKLPLSSLMLRGRSKNAVVILGLQDVDGFAEVYGEKIANEILGQCGNKALLRAETHRSTDFNSKCVGEEEYIDPQSSESTGASGKSKTTTFQLVKRDLVLPSEFMSIPPTNRTNGLTGYYSSSPIGVYRSTIEAATLDRLLMSPDPTIPNFIPRPVEHQFLTPWTDEDRIRLGLIPRRQGRSA